MKLTKIAVTFGALMIGGSAIAEVSANIGATNNYIWRGVTQTDNDAAVSGGLDYAHDSGLYAGTWVSNVDYGGASAEVDFYGGFANELDSISYDIGAIYYYYPGRDSDADINFSEAYLNLGFGPFSAGVNWTFWKEQSGDTHDLYYTLGAGTDIAPTWGIGATLGYYDFDSGDNYTHGQIDITKEVGDFGSFTFTVSTVFDQDFDDDDSDVDKDPLFVVSWAKTFD
jgi:uncharacterized protein (TIGR02001 family)